MTETDRRATWETYASAWKETKVEKKRDALARSVLPSLVYRDPQAEVAGLDALIEYMLGFHQQVPGGWFETTQFLTHHDRSIVRWNMRDKSGAIVGDGISYGEYDRAGKLVAISGFFGAPAAS